MVCLPAVFLLWRRGGVDPQDQAAACAWILFCAAAAWIALPAGRAPFRLPWAAAAAALPPWVQLVPLEGWQALYSPARRELIAAFQELGVEPANTISLYPAETLQRAVALSAWCALYALSRGAALRWPRSSWGVAAMLALLAASQGVLGLRQFLEARLRAGAGHPAAHGTFVNPDHYAVFLEAGLALCLGLLAALRLAGVRPRRWFDNVGGLLPLAGAAALCWLGIILSYSRMGLLVAAAITLAGAAFFGLRGRTAAWTAVAPALLAAALALSLGVRGLEDRFRTLWEDGGDPGRIAIWADTLPAAAEHRWTGAGLGTFVFAFQRSSMYFPRKVADHAHSDYLELAVEIGLPGAMFLFAVLGAAAGGCAVRLWRRRRERAATDGLAAGCLLAAGGMLAHAAVDFPLQMPALAAVLAILLGTAAGLAPPARQGRAIPGWLGAAAFLVLGALSAGLAAGWTPVAAAGPPWGRAQEALGQGRFAAARSALQEALQANPHAATLWLERAKVLEIEGETEAALAHARLAQRLEPFTARVEWPLAQLQLRAGKQAAAERRLARLALHVPDLRPAVYLFALRAGISPERIAWRIVPASSAARGEYRAWLSRLDARFRPE